MQMYHRGCREESSVGGPGSRACAFSFCIALRSLTTHDTTFIATGSQSISRLRR